MYCPICRAELREIKSTSLLGMSMGAFECDQCKDAFMIYHKPGSFWDEGVKDLI